jgi:hypothetical protein
MSSRFRNPVPLALLMALATGCETSSSAQLSPVPEAEPHVPFEHRSYTIRHRAIDAMDEAARNEAENWMRAFSGTIIKSNVRLTETGQITIEIRHESWSGNQPADSERTCRQSIYMHAESLLGTPDPHIPGTPDNRSQRMMEYFGPAVMDDPMAALVAASQLMAQTWMRVVHADIPNARGFFCTLDPSGNFSYETFQG